MIIPTPTEIAEIIDRLISGEVSRESAARWAGPRHLVEAPDPLVEEALDLLTLIDGWQIDEQGNRSGYLFDFADLARVRTALGKAGAAEDGDG